jgi:protein O-mannosyl-transferase
MSRRKSKPVRGDRHGAPQPPPRTFGAFWIAVGLVVLTAIVFAPVRHFSFVNWDDQSYITENPNIPEGLTWHSVRWALTTGYSPYWHPMTWLSHLLDVQLFGLDAGPHHLTSLLLHSAATVAVFVLFRRMTGAAGRSAFLAAMFGVHPLHVESVAWIAERKDVLSTLFWALALLAYVSYARRQTIARYAAVVGLFGLGLMSKPMVVTLPVVLLLLDIWPLQRVRFTAADAPLWRRVLLDKLPLLALALGTSIATVVVQHRVGAMAGLDVLPWHLRAANATIAYIEYAWKTLWPTNLAAFYPYHVYSAWQVLAAAVALVSATAAALWHRRDRPYLIVGWAWYLITLAPVIGLLQAGEQRVADRFMYVPMIGLLILIAWGVPELVERWRPVARFVPVAATGLVMASAIAARAQAEHWADSVTLWQHATQVTPDSYIAFENLGQALRERGELEDAAANYQRALALAPAGSPAYQAVIYNSLGLVLTRQGKGDAAIPQFAAAARLNPQFAEAQGNLGNALAASNRLREAVEHYRAAVTIKPDFTEALVGLGSALVSQKRAEEAVAAYRDALKIDPGLAQAHNGLGAALAMLGRDDRALTEYTEALRLKPDLPTAHLNIAVLQIKQGRLAEARQHLETALAIDPTYEPARQLLARVSAAASGGG